MKKGLLKKAVAEIEYQNPNLNNNQFIVETWKQLGLQGRIGGVAFSELRHFMNNSPDVESITRTRRYL